MKKKKVRRGGGDTVKGCVILKMPRSAPVDRYRVVPASREGDLVWSRAARVVNFALEESLLEKLLIGPGVFGSARSAEWVAAQLANRDALREVGVPVVEVGQLVGV